MAFNLSAVLTFSAKGVQSSLNRSGKALDRFKDRLHSANAKLSAVGTGARTVGAAGSIMAAGIGVALKKHMDLERQMDSVAAKMKDGAEYYDQLKMKAEEMGASTVFSAKEAAQGLEYLALAGFNATDAMAVLPTVLHTAAAGAMDLGRASDIVTDSMSAMSPIMKKYGDRAAQATILADTMALAQARTNTNIEQLGEAITYGGGAMANLGIPLEQIIGSMGALADAGIKGSSGGTALTNMMAKLAKPTSKAQELLQGMGITMDKLQTPEGKLRSMAEIVEAFEVGLRKHPKALDNAAAAQEIFGRRGQRAFFALQNKGGKALEELFTELREKGPGSAKIMYEKMTDNLYGAWKSVTSATDGTITKLGEMFAKIFEIKDVLQAVAKPFQQFVMAMNTIKTPMDKWSDAQKKLMSSNVGQFALGVVDAFQDLKETVVSLWNSARSLFTSLESSGASFRSISRIITKAAVGFALLGPPLLALGAAILFLTPIISGVASAVGVFGTVLTFLASPVGLVVAALGALGYVVYNLMGGWEGLKEAASTFAAGFMDSFMPWIDMMKEDLAPTFEMLGNAWESLMKAIFGGSRKAKNDFTGFGSVVGFVAGGIVKAFTGVIQIISLVAEGFIRIMTLGVKAAKWVGKFFGIGAGEEISENVKEGAKGVKSAEESATKAAREKVVQLERKANEGGVVTETKTAGGNVIPFPVKETAKTTSPETENISAAHMKAKTSSAKPQTVQVNVAPSTVNVPDLNVVVENTVDENGINTIVKKQQRHHNNKIGLQLKETAAEPKSQAGYGG